MINQGTIGTFSGERGTTVVIYYSTITVKILLSRQCCAASTVCLCVPGVTFHSSSLAGQTSQFLNGMSKFSEVILAVHVMTLLMDQGWSFLLVGQSTGIWRVAVRKRIVHVHLGAFNLSWPEPVLFGLLDLTNGKQPKCK